MLEYINQKEINEINEAIQKIDANLRLSQFSSIPSENRACSCGLTIKEKGNKKIIEQLKALGFRIVWRRKDSSDYSDKYEGYSMLVTLEKPL